MEEFDLAPSCSAILQKCFITSLRHIESRDLEEGQTGHAIILQIQSGISYKYSGVIDSTMDVLTSFYSSLPADLDLSTAAIEFLVKPLDGLNKLRQNPLFNHKIALDSCVGSILALVGPKHFLNALPISISGDPADDGDIPARCGWLIPVFEAKLERRVEVAVFFNYFAKMADTMIKATENLDKYQAPIYLTLYREIWALFPKFCQNPSDLARDFLKPGAAKGLNAVLESDADNHKGASSNYSHVFSNLYFNNRIIPLKEIKPLVLSGIRKLVRFALRKSKDEKHPSNDYKLVMEKYSKNYLKTLLNMYRTNDQSVLAMSTAKEIIKLTPRDKIIEFYTGKNH